MSARTTVPKKTTKLRTLLNSSGLDFLLEAHNGLSARIAEEAGFSGIWASGLSISASLGVRDSNEASWTQVLEIAEFMSDATTIPILIDADTGYGNFNNARRLVRKLEQRGIAGLCIEDKVFPKTNSFLDGLGQSLASIDEFARKIRAVKDTQTDDDFCVVARIESLIVGAPMDEALRRAEAYHAAGADAVLIHSRSTSPAEVLTFMDLWDGRCPVVIVPTRYYRVSTECLERAGFSLVIWANHMMRSCITAMQRTAATVRRERSIASTEASVAGLDEVFRLQNAEELAAAELRYLPGPERPPATIDGVMGRRRRGSDAGTGSTAGAQASGTGHVLHLRRRSTDVDSANRSADSRADRDNRGVTATV